MNTIKILDKFECCGCGSCMQRCPKQAIEMKENEEGFLYPIIDEKKCINCGLCTKVCPQLKQIKEKDTEYPKAYAMRNKNTEELKQSSSGGIFKVLANYVLENDGVVFGAAYDKELSVNHIKIEKKEELVLLQSSKYVQSNINNTYKEAEEELKKNKLVLFSGTPCQIIGLNSYLMEEYENLITCDLVCHGVPSQKLFRKYLEYLSEKFKSKVIKYNFRSKKKKGWGLISEVETEDRKIRFIEPDFDPYYSNFLDSSTYRENCYKCHYTNYNRVSNITLADFWGINGIHPKFYSEQGNSLILSNNKKGDEILLKISDKIDLLSTNINEAAKHNKNLIKPSSRPNIRDSIYNDIDSMDAQKYVQTRLKIKYTSKKILKAIIPTRVKKILKKARGLIK